MAPGVAHRKMIGGTPESGSSEHKAALLRRPNATRLNDLIRYDRVIDMKQLVFYFLLSGSHLSILYRTFVVSCSCTGDTSLSSFSLSVTSSTVNQISARIVSSRHLSNPPAVVGLVDLQGFVAVVFLLTRLPTTTKTTTTTTTKQNKPTSTSY